MHGWYFAAAGTTCVQNHDRDKCQQGLIHQAVFGGQKWTQKTVNSKQPSCTATSRFHTVPSIPQVNRTKGFKHAVAVSTTDHVCAVNFQSS